MHDATLVYLLTDTQVLLAMKKIGFGKGHYNGVGGKVEPEDTSIRHTAVREAYEEIGVIIKEEDLRRVATLDFFFPHVPIEKKFNQRVHVYFTTAWDGEPKESDEMKPEWFDLDELLDSECPHYNVMWPDDKIWFPKALRGKMLKGTFLFAKEGGVLMHRLDEEN